MTRSERRGGFKSCARAVFFLFGLAIVNVVTDMVAAAAFGLGPFRMAPFRMAPHRIGS